MSLRYFAALALAAGAWAQSDVPPPLHIQNVTAYVDYYSIPPEAFSSPIAMRNAGAAGVSGTLVYSKFLERSGIAFSYTPSYIRRYRSLVGNSNNHFLMLTGHAGSRLTFNYALNGALSSTSDVLFTPTQLARLAGASAPPGGLGSAVVTGGAGSNEVATVLGEAPGVGSPAGLLIYGDRLWSVSATTGFEYAKSSRLTLHMNLTAQRTAAYGDVSALPVNVYRVPYTLSGSAEGGFGYLLSPRSRIGGSLRSMRSYSRDQDAYVHSALFTYARAMGPRWFVDLHGGAAMIDVVHASRPVPSRIQPAGGGMLGYRTFANTFLFSGERTAGDAYAVGATNTLSGSAAWLWQRPGEPWSLRADYSEERLTGSGFTPVRARRATGGIGRQFGRHFSLLLQYAYLCSLESATGFMRRPTQHTGRLSFFWTPYGAAAQ